MEEKEIREKLIENLKKKVTISALEEKFHLSKLEILGHIKRLKDEGMKISYYEKDNEAFVSINEYPDLSKEYTYHIDVDNNEKLKCAYISDLRFGSKNEQIAILNDLYKKFASEGVKYVFVLGNLIEGVYTGEDANAYMENLITNDAEAQTEHLINYYPHVEGIKTLFIAGKNELKVAKKINVGETIAKARNDMIYLGPKSCLVTINNVSMRIEQLKKGDAYTIAYEPQKYLRSMPSYEDYDLVMLGGTRSLQHFPSLRDMQIFTVPSVVERTPKMRNGYEQNTIGALQTTISFTKTGKLKRVVPEIIPYYQPSKESYLTIKKLDIDKDNKPGKGIVDENSHMYFDDFDKLYRRIKKEQSFDELKDRLGYSELELEGVIDILNTYGREIEIVNEGGERVVRKHVQIHKDPTIKPPKEELHKVEMLVASDTHYGSIWCQPSFVNTAAREAYNRGIKIALHIGDITDGDYAPLRPNHPKETFLHGSTAQIDYVVENLPRYPGMTWYGITGSHDKTHEFKYGDRVGDILAKKRPDFIYLGEDKGIFTVDNCKIELFHPGGGTSRILSTKAQNGIDQLASKTKPNIQIRGHYHKVFYMFYRNIHEIYCPCNVDTSKFMMLNELPNLMGDYFLTVYYDDLGNVQYLDVEPMLFNQDDVRQYDFDNPRNYVKSKILTPFHR